LIAQSVGLAPVIDTISPVTVPRRHQDSPEKPTERLRLGCDPLHRHLLAPECSPLLAWHPVESWSELLLQGALDAALISVAAMSVASAPEPSDQSTLWGPDISVMPLGRRPLVLIHAAGEHCRRTGQGVSEGDPNPRLRTAWELLLPPEVQQPLLWRQLERLGLLSLRDCSAGDCESWLQELLQGPHLLPAHLSLLEQAPWRDAGLRAVPPPEPLEEQLWLLVREGQEHRPAIDTLATQLREQLIRANPAEE
jgi:hypothetical protein